MLKIDWFLYLRHRVIFGFWMKRIHHARFPRTTDKKWKLAWRWDWKDSKGMQQAIGKDKLPWHRCWKWYYLR